MNTLNHSQVTRQTFTLDELCALTDLTKRTVRYYVQMGLVSRPEGETRAAKYTSEHLEQLLLVKKWTTAGLSLDRIGELLQGGAPPVPERRPSPGSITVCSHLHVAPGVELVIEPSRAALTAEQLRQFVRVVLNAYDQMNQDTTTKGKK